MNNQEILNHAIGNNWREGTDKIVEAVDCGDYIAVAYENNGIIHRYNPTMDQIVREAGFKEAVKNIINQ